MYEDEKPWLETRNVNGCFKTTGIALLIIAAIIFFASCARIIDAGHGKLVSYQKQFHSTYFIVTVLAADSCTEFVSKWNSNCWQCKDANVPQNWNIEKWSNNKYFIKPVK